MTVRGIELYDFVVVAVVIVVVIKRRELVISLPSMALWKESLLLLLAAYDNAPVQII